MTIWKLLYFWMCYWFPFFPACPAIGRKEDADCIFLQACGRNSLPDEGLGKVLWELRIRADMDDLEVFRLLSYQKFDPGRMNRALGGYCKRLVNTLNIPLIGQWETLYAIWESDPRWYLEHRKMLDVLWPRPEGYFATYHVKLDSRECMIRRGLSRPLEVAHPAMLARAVAVIWRTGVAPIVEPVSPFTFWAHELWLWDEDSVQGWVRRFLPSSHDIFDREQESIVDKLMPSFLKRECLGRIHHIVFGFVSLRPPALA